MLQVMIPRRADNRMSHMGENFFFRRYLYIRRMTASIMVTMMERMSAFIGWFCGMQFCRIIMTPVARMIPMIQGFRPAMIVCT